jgi:hypothetical protein
MEIKKNPKISGVVLPFCYPIGLICVSVLVGGDRWTRGGFWITTREESSTATNPLASSSSLLCSALCVYTPSLPEQRTASSSSSSSRRVRQRAPHSRMCVVQEPRHPVTLTRHATLNTLREKKKKNPKRFFSFSGCYRRKKKESWKSHPHPPSTTGSCVAWRFPAAAAFHPTFIRM